MDWTLRLAGPVTTLAYLWRLTRRDGLRLGFTSHDRDILHAGLRYRAAPSFVPSAIRTTAGLDVDSLDLAGALDHAALTAADLRAGRWDAAALQVALIDWLSPEDGVVVLASGWFGEVRAGERHYSVEVRGLTDALQAPALALCSASCRAELGDSRCTVSLRAHTVLARVEALIEPDRLQMSGLDATADCYAGGRLRWWTGANAGLDAAVLASAGTELVLRTLPLAAPQPGDLAEVIAGCDKRYDTCRTKFNNRLNFQGEPLVPGVDALVRYPGV